MEDNEYATGKYLAWHPLGLTCAHHPLVQQATEQVLKYILDLGENNTLNLKLLLRKTAYLVKT